MPHILLGFKNNLSFYGMIIIIEVLPIYCAILYSALRLALSGHFMVMEFVCTFHVLGVQARGAMNTDSET